REGKELSGERLICVYTYDSDDMQDLQRIVDTLRSNLTYQDRLIYKEDAFTLAGIYASSKNVHGNATSKWYVRSNETVIRRVKGYRPLRQGENYWPEGF